MRWWPALPGVLLFAWFAGDGLFSNLFPDEMMNIYRVWHEPWTELLRRTVLFWQGSARPLGAFFYRPLFDAFGFAPLPYRAVCMGLLLANLLIAYRLAGKLSGSTLTAAVTAVLFGYHAYLSDLYYSSATIYDLLCFCFAYSAVLAYLERRWVRFAALYLLAMLAKEAAAGLPAVLVVIEWAAFAKEKREWRGPAGALLLAGAVLLPLAWGEHSLSGVGAYQLHPRVMGENLGRYLGMMFYAQRDLVRWEAAMVVSLAIAAAVWVRSAGAWVGLAIALVLPAPVLMIEPRSFYVFYLAFFGWTLLAACILDRIAQGATPVRPAVRAVALVALLVAVLAPLHRFRKPYGNAWVALERDKAPRMIARLTADLPSLKRGARVDVVDDPYEPGDWILTFIFRLQYRDDGIEVVRRKSGPAAEGRPFDCVLNLADYRLEIVSGCR